MLNKMGVKLDNGLKMRQLRPTVSDKIHQTAPYEPMSRVILHALIDYKCYLEVIK